MLQVARDCKSTVARNKIKIYQKKHFAFPGLVYFLLLCIKWVTTRFSSQPGLVRYTEGYTRRGGEINTGVWHTANVTFVNAKCKKTTAS